MKLSEAIKAALPLGIPQATCCYFGFKAGQLCACAQGQGLLGAKLITIEQAREYATGYTTFSCADTLRQHFGKTVAGVVPWNDDEKLSLPDIIDRLQARGD